VVISIRRVSLGGGYRYLMDSVAVGDGNPERSGLSRYYAASGTPPGVFLGAGLADLAGGKGVEAGSEVSEEHLQRMLAGLADPITGQPVGGTPRAPKGGVPVAGFDLTFSPPKSVSTAWALADEGTKAVIHACHRQAIEITLAWAETHVFHSRSGTNGIAEEDLGGIIATAFTHWSSRADDPQLHDHVVVWNRARSLSDGRWRTLDSRAVFKATTTLAELHHGVLSDLLTAHLGVGWEPRSRRHSPRPRYEITGVPETLMAEFSQRAGQIAACHDDQLRAFRTAHGRSPTPVEAMRLRHQATLSTRPAKTHASLAELTATWRARADRHVPATAQTAWVSSLAGRNDLPLLRADDLAGPILDDAAATVLDTVAEVHATFSRMNLQAEAHRILHGVRFATPEQRIAVAETITDLATQRAVTLTPPSELHVPARYRRPDGTSRLHPQTRIVYTTQTLLDAEARLLDAGRDRSAPTVAIGTVAALCERPLPGRPHPLSVDQAVAVEAIATSGRSVDLLVGPAGTGKSTTMAGLRHAWETDHGPRSVLGLAPSAAAAEVLADELGIDTDNTAKWLTEWRRLPQLAATRAGLTQRLGRADPRSAGAATLRRAVTELDTAIDARRLHPGQLVILDEASLAGTFALDELVTAARTAGAKVVLVGDPHQLSAVDAGGAFDLLVRDRGDLAPRLSEIRRFHHSWEKVASVQLRAGNPASIDTYQTHGRLAGGTRDEILDRLYTAWLTDTDHGLTSLMIAADTATVTQLNARARADRITAGAVHPDGLRVADGQTAGVGDQVITRHNNRLLTTGRRWVKNGDRWTVTATHPDGSMAVRRLDGHGEVVLPADYVTDHLELGYATTAHRAQGRTVDTAHAYITPTTTREVLYVAATRGRHTNHLYIDTAWDPDPTTSHPQPGNTPTLEDVLTAVLGREGADLSAHETRRRHQAHAESIATLAAEYQTLATTALEDRYDQLLQRCALTTDQLDAIRTSPAHGALLAALRDAEAAGLDLDTALPDLVAGRTLAGIDDPAATLHDRIDTWTATTAPDHPAATALILGLLPRATHITDPDLQAALAEREAAITARAYRLVLDGLASRAPWLQQLGVPPTDPTSRRRWLTAAATVAAYRDRWGMTNDPRPLGGEPGASVEQASQHRRARAAVDQAEQLGLNFGANAAHPVPAISSQPELHL